MFEIDEHDFGKIIVKFTTLAIQSLTTSMQVNGNIDEIYFKVWRIS